MTAIQEGKVFRKLGEVTNFKCCREVGGKEKRIWQLRKVICEPDKGSLSEVGRQEDSDSCR